MQRQIIATVVVTAVVVTAVVVAAVVVAAVVVAAVVVAVHPTVTMITSKIVFPMPRLMVLQQNSKSKIATILYMEAVEPVEPVEAVALVAAVAVKILTIQEVVIQAARKTIMTITKPTISLTYKIRDLQYQNFRYLT